MAQQGRKVSRSQLKPASSLLVVLRDALSFEIQSAQERLCRKRAPLSGPPIPVKRLSDVAFNPIPRTIHRAEDRVPNTTAHFARMLERPSVQKLLAFEAEVKERFAAAA